MRVFHWNCSEGYDTLEIFAFVRDDEGVEEAKQQVLRARKWTRFDGDAIGGVHPYEITIPDAIVVSHSG